MTRVKRHVVNLCLSAMFFAMGLVLPFLTGQIQSIGNMLLPMHIPVFLCALICGWKYGLAVGALLPIMRSLIFTMPIMYPNAIGMSFELAAYGFMAGFLYEISRWKCVKALYRCLVASMLTGRAVWGLAMTALLGVGGKTFGFGAFVSGAFLNAVPGIIIQLVLIPAIMIALDKTKLVKFGKNEKKSAEQRG